MKFSLNYLVRSVERAAYSILSPATSLAVASSRHEESANNAEGQESKKNGTKNTTRQNTYQGKVDLRNSGSAVRTKTQRLDGEP